MADDGQSPAGDQGVDSGDSGYAQYLDSVPPEIREQVEPLFKEFDGNVTKKFQEHAEYRKQWEPYEETGIKDLDPESLKGLLEFAQMANDPEQFGQWWQNAGKEMGLFEKFAPSEDLDLDLEDDLPTEKIAELVEKQVAEKLGPVEQTIQQQGQEREAAQANEEVASAMDTFKAENKALFEGDEKGEVERMVARLAYSYSDDDSLSPAEMIQKGGEDYKNMIGQGAKGLFDDKLKQPKPPEGPGGADMSPEKITSFKDPRLDQAALAKLKGTG